MQNAAYLYTLDIWPIGLALLACGIIKMFCIGFLFGLYFTLYIEK